MKTNLGIGLAAIIFASAAAGPTEASPVSLVGGFTSYTGPAWNKTYPGPPQFEVTSPFLLDGSSQRKAVPTVPLPGDPDPNGSNLFDSAGIGMATLDLTTSGLAARAAEFWINFGSKDAVNRVSFAANTPVGVSVGDEFKLGTFSFTNGGWFGTYPLADGTNYVYPESVFHFRLVTSSNDPRLNGHVFEGDLHLRVTGGTNPTAEEDADVFYFAGFTQLAEVHVYEDYNKPVGASNFGTVDLYGRIGSLIPTRFDNANGVFFTQPGAVVPEPSSWMLLVGGIAAAGASLRKRRRA